MIFFVSCSALISHLDLAHLVLIYAAYNSKKVLPLYTRERHVYVQARFGKRIVPNLVLPSPDPEHLSNESNTLFIRNLLVDVARKFRQGYFNSIPLLKSQIRSLHEVSLKGNFGSLYLCELMLEVHYLLIKQDVR